MPAKKKDTDAAVKTPPERGVHLAVEREQSKQDDCMKGQKPLILACLFAMAGVLLGVFSPSADDSFSWPLRSAMLGAALIVGLMAFGFLATWVHVAAKGSDSVMLRFLERVRTYIADESPSTNEKNSYQK